MEIFELWPGSLFVFTGLVGLLVGSFLNVVAFRVPIMMERAWREQCNELAEEDFEPPPHAQDSAFNLWAPRSGCPSCGNPIPSHYNIPVVSYVWLRGRCAACGVRISPRYPFIESLAALAGMTVAWILGPTWQTVAGLAFTWTLLVLAIIDIDKKLLPDAITLPLMWAGLLLSLVHVDGAVLFADVRSSVIGAAAGYLSLWSVYQLFKLVTGKEGMGYGDFKLLAALGAWLGWQMLPLVIVLSAVVGAVVGVVLIVVGGHSRQTPIPFGPYLAAAGWIALLFGDEVMGLYGQFLG